MSQTTDSTVKRLFTAPRTKAYDAIAWAQRDAELKNPFTGEVVFAQKNIEIPEAWSLNALNIVAQKYFSGTPGTKERETSVKQLINRVVDTIVRHGKQEGYFDSSVDAETFREELKYVLATQRAAFNSPVWFNIGASERAQQSSACFILGVEDTMPAILQWYTDEGMIFKGGSGSGVNISPIRSSVESLGKSAGTASGPLSFMRGADASAGAIKSGGKTRRAAKMVILNVDHPDIEEFIWCKSIEEDKARVLQEAGFDMSLDGKDIFSVQYQNANNSVRVTDDFMKAVEADADWDLKAVSTGKTVRTVKARHLYRQFAEAAWRCADPGMQFDTTINHWHTTPNAGRINGSNPCSEYMHLDNSACNLASINLLHYLNDDFSFDIESFKHTVELMFTAQEILVGYSSYPTERIAKNARAYRALGIGYANLGALLMAQGLPYDSDEGRAQAAAITAILTGHSYATSARLARKVGPFAGFHKDRENMLNVLRMHREAVNHIDPGMVAEDLLDAAVAAWDEAVEFGELYGVRNSQASVLAPTGTIGLMMDCDTTGIEPDLGLVKVKKLVGGGTMNIVNQTVPRALTALGYTREQVNDIVAYIDAEKTIVGAPHLNKGHEAVFACSMGDNSIHYLGHVKMMAAVQPFLSGAISKTVNMPESATVEDVEQLHIDSWKMGLKAVAIYRNNCKVAQPLSMAKKDGDDDDDAEEAQAASADLSEDGKIVLKGAVRRKLPRIRNSRTYRFVVADLEGFFTVGEYADGAPGELFISVSRQGSTLAGLMDSFAISVSHGLQYGVPLKSYVKTLRGTSFAPFGITDDPDIRTATSVTDYIVRRLALDYLSFDDRLELGLASFEDLPDEQTTLLEEDETASKERTNQDATRQAELNESVSETQPMAPAAKSESTASPKVVNDSTAPLCYNCGNQTQRSGSCYVCTSCGSTTGCS
ncbi:ribonucleoside-diphosphate reductase, adenosylcobalamin-dependent [Candidatus Saccharibacteria bacterium]|nr:MAG: ribonucleoside-diphosphate reductase, adenosylcobalamin-dependent [Candidatus Saccharibacteria bacterium]PID98827.1 MAG: ribonucleoside-diphosphate reductase, adenosylcobalamin-dependent [Candidatus Saccharibacteria bacterium]